MKNILLIWICLTVLLVPLTGCAVEQIDNNNEMDKLQLEYAKEVQRIRSEYSNLLERIEQCKTTTLINRAPMDSETRNVLLETIDDAEKLTRDEPDIPEMPDNIETAEEIITELKNLSFMEMDENLQFARDAFLKSLEAAEEREKNPQIITMTKLEDGIYVSQMLGSKKGEIDLLGTCFRAYLDGGDLVVHGSFNYMEDAYFSDYSRILKNNVYRFPVTGETKCLLTGGGDIMEYQDSLQSFISAAQGYMDDDFGITLEIELRHGKVTTVSMSS